MTLVTACKVTHKIKMVTFFIYQMLLFSTKAIRYFDNSDKVFRILFTGLCLLLCVTTIAKFQGTFSD